jgi:hypothetical protein
MDLGRIFGPMENWNIRHTPNMVVGQLLRAGYGDGNFPLLVLRLSADNVRRLNWLGRLYYLNIRALFRKE